jgi:membrane protease YdiL (CAAX protease family)
MDDLIPTQDQPRQRWLDRIQALIEVILLSGMVSGFIAVLPFSLRARGNLSLTKDVTTVALYLLLESWIAIVMLYAVMKAHGETPRDLGWRTSHWRFDSIIGAAIVPALFLCSAMVNYTFRTWLPHYYVDQNPLTQTIRTPRDLALFSMAALFAGGIKEELQRAFILIRFRDHLGGSGVGLLIWSLAFGAGHYVQGLQGVVAATLFGFVFGLVYLTRRSLVAPIVAHSLYDTAAILGYWFTRSS